MKYFIAGLLLIILLTATAHAKPNGNNHGQGRPGGSERMARMQQNLGLSDEQVSQIQEIRQNGGGRQEIRAILTEEQLTLMKEHRKNHRGGGGKGRGAPPRQEGKPPDSNDE